MIFWELINQEELWAASQ